MGLRELVRRAAHAAGFDVVRYPARDFDPWLTDVLELVRPYTMTSPERIHALYEATRYVCRWSVPGAIVECGVWKGGSAMVAAKALLDAGDTERDLVLFDTFSGFESAPPGPQDVGRDDRPGDALVGDESYAVGTAEVRQALATIGYPDGRIRLVPGRVEDTVPEEAPEQIAILRLDTDWYESTKHELVHLYPLIAPGGVLIVDDYGYWKGARQAVDEFLREQDVPVLLNRIDDCGRVAIVPGLPGPTSA